MISLLSINAGTGNSKCRVDFGVPNKESEFDEMYSLRYKVYRKKKLIKKNSGRADKDEIDYSGNCKYFIAKINSKVVGSIRVIHGDELPTQDEYFEITMPEVINTCNQSSIAEIGRLSCDPDIFKDVKIKKRIPRHMILLGIFFVACREAEETNDEIVIGALKDYIKSKLEKISFPIKTIEKHKLIYDPIEKNDPLEGFFDEDKTGKVWPIYGKVSDLARYFESIFLNKRVFKVVNDQELILKNKVYFQMALLGKFLGK